MNHSANYSAVGMTESWEPNIITAFEAGGLSLALIIFLMWVIRMILLTRRNRHER